MSDSLSYKINSKSLGDLSDELNQEIMSYYHSTGNRMVNRQFNNSYQILAYQKFKKLMEINYPWFTVPEYDPDINWKYDYDNVLYYEKYIKLMNEKYPWVPAVVPILNGKEPPEIIFKRNWKNYYISIHNSSHLNYTSAFPREM